MILPHFDDFFDGVERSRLLDLLQLAYDEDGPDLTSAGIFAPTDELQAVIVAKQAAVVAGLPVIPLLLDLCAMPHSPQAHWQALVAEGELVQPGRTLVELSGPARQMLRAERLILNIMARLSGIATLTRHYVDALSGTGVRLLDTRKTQPGMRGLDKYAVRVGGGYNHRRNLAEMLMIKDNHIDAAGSITAAVSKARAFLQTCPPPLPPIEVECRTDAEVREAVACGVERIMLDNMDAPALSRALTLIAPTIEAEISGNVALETIRQLALIGPRHPDFISVGRLTHSVRAADFSMRIAAPTNPAKAGA